MQLQEPESPVDSLSAPPFVPENLPETPNNQPIEPEPELPIRRPNPRRFILLSLGAVACVGLAGVGLVFTLLPSAGRCGAKQISGRNIVGATNRAQQAFWLENQRFATTLDELQLGLTPESLGKHNFEYSIHATDKAVLTYGIAKTKDIRSYVGAVFIVPIADLPPESPVLQGDIPQGETTMIAGLCAAKSLGPQKLAEPTYRDGVVDCGATAELMP